MLKKKLNIILLIIGAGILIKACSLEEVPVGFLSTDNFYQTANDAEAAVAYAYAILPEIEYYSRHFFHARSVPTEEYTLKSDAGASQHDLDQLRPLPNNREVTDTYRYAYIGINRANAVIENVPNIEMNDALRNQYLGEGYFLRALHYFNLVRMFGGVPIHDVTVRSADNASRPLSSIEEVYNFIIQDLETAIDLMNMEHRGGRANRTAAWSKLAKVYLFLASAGDTGVERYEFVSNPDTYYNLAAQYSNYVINDQNRYHLANDLRSIFDVYNTDGPERIFFIQVDRTGEHEGNYSKLPLVLAPYYDGADITLTDGTTFPSGFNHAIMEQAFFYSFHENDKRRLELIVDTVYVDGEELTFPGGGMEAPFTRKYVDPDQVGQQTSTDIPVLRFSDILLVYAEAVGPTTEGYHAVNQIRERAGLDPLPGGLSTRAFRDLVLQERSWELNFEGHRLFDLRRTNMMEEILEGVYGKTIHNNAYFFEIPQIEQDVNTEIN
jgi:starch-binding outer membrane protein, SusD/RagB family